MLRVQSQGRGFRDFLGVKGLNQATSAVNTLPSTCAKLFARGVQVTLKPNSRLTYCVTSLEDNSLTGQMCSAVE